MTQFCLLPKGTEMTIKNKNSIFADGEPFFVGANYWASHAGTNMWSDWREDVVEEDFRVLAENGVQVLRVFPLWNDFQPLKKHEAWASLFVEMRMDEEPLPHTPLGQAGINPVMMERFRTLTQLAEKYGLKLIVGIMTGWMSGRMHKPAAFYNTNVMTAPEAIKWQVRFVRAFVRELRNEPAIVAWDLGNECNCLAQWKTSSELWNWCNAISSAIRVEDTDKPIVSGMHGLSVNDNNDKCAPITDQAELTDILCTHPYPLFTPHSKVDPVNTIRNAFHAAAETSLYADIGNVPAFIEEAGNLGPGLSSEKVSAAYLENMLWNSYAHNCRGFLWWCAHEQSHLKQTPYDWTALERSLGLLRCDRSHKPVMEVMGKFGRMTSALQLPALRRNAVCILTNEQDQWGVAYMTFILAKQAGFDIEFQYAEQPLKKADFYLMPSVQGNKAVTRHSWQKIMDAVTDNGATLYISSGDCTLEPFYGEWSGITLETVSKAAGTQEMIADDFRLVCNWPWQLEVSTENGEVLAKNQWDDPVLIRTKCGKGTILYSSLPVEASICEQPKAFLTDYYKLYRKLAELAGVKREVTRTNPMLTLTEHFEQDGSLLVCAVNNTPNELTDTLSAPGWVFCKSVAGVEQYGEKVTLPGNSGTVLCFRKK